MVNFDATIFNAMKKIVVVVSCILFVVTGRGQTVGKQLEKAWQQFENDSQLKHAISSLYVIDAKTGQVIFDKNSQIGLAPVSTQKIITSVAAFEMLGKNFRYKTELGLLSGNAGYSIYVKPSGDPTFGSWRWETTNEKTIQDNIVKSFNSVNKPFNSTIAVNQKGWDSQRIPDGWIWQDIGNYYGAGAGALNWRENQFDLSLQSTSKVGDKVVVVKSNPPLVNYTIQSEATAAKAGTGDNAYLYFPVTGREGVVRGTIPVNENKFEISGAMPDPPAQFLEKIKSLLVTKAIKKDNISALFMNDDPVNKPEIIVTHFSPALDSIIYWFLKKSINLYGEALIKTIAFQKNNTGSTDEGVKLVRKFYTQIGIDEEELNMSDGSGLSPQNRVTTHAQVTILKYAQTKDWYPYFYDALPLYNDMKMKSGTISDVKGFCGYQKAKDGREYIFSFLVNNYSGRSSGVVAKMYKVLDELK